MKASASSPRPARARLVQFGHYSSVLMIPGIIGAVTGYVFWNSKLINSICDIPVIIWLASMFIDTRIHQGSLCERCIASTPLDPQGAAETYRSALKFYHSKKLMIGFTFSVALIMVSLVAVHGIAGDLMQGIGWALSAGFEWVTVKHKRLVPWCPWCRWPDGGGHESVAPVPSTPVTA